MVHHGSGLAARISLALRLLPGGALPACGELSRRERGVGFTWRVYLEGFILIWQPCGICSAGGVGFAGPGMRDLQGRIRVLFQPCEICSAGNRLRFNGFRQHVLGFVVFRHGSGRWVHGLAHGRRVLFGGVRLLDPFEGGRVGFHGEVPYDLAVLRQTVPASLAETRVPLVAAADEPAFLKGLQAGAHGSFRQFRDVDDGGLATVCWTGS